MNITLLSFVVFINNTFLYENIHLWQKYFTFLQIRVFLSAVQPQLVFAITIYRKPKTVNPSEP